jgi:glycerate 2-kinase
MTHRDQLDAIRAAALAAAEPRRLTAAALHAIDDAIEVAGRERIPLAAGGRIVVLAAGKAARGMAMGASDALGGWIAEGSIATVSGGGGAPPGFELWEGGHPLPDAGSLAAAADALRLARAAGPDDLVVCLLSGGASALWAAPPAGVPLGALREVTGALLRAGAPIGEVNAVRGRLSRIAAGRLARAAAPARIVTLAISDVVDAPPETIGSGPTLPDGTTPAAALEVLIGRGVRVPPAVRALLQEEAARRAGAGDGPAPVRGSFHVLASVRDALDGAAAEAARHGYEVELVDDRMAGEARYVGARAGRLARTAAGRGRRARLLGGETTVTVRGDGRGGRSQELALALALELEGLDGVSACAFGTDGVDGPTDAAGGYADGGTAARARGAGVDPAAALARNDAYRALAAAGDLLRTGPTGTNVNDLVVVLVER